MSRESLEVLLNNIPERIGLRQEKIALALVYGSSARGVTSARDIDVLIVARETHGRYIRLACGGRLASIHLVPKGPVYRDITSDKYGWMFLTKFLGPLVYNKSHGPAVNRYREMAYLRLLVHYSTLRGSYVVGDRRNAFRGIMSVLQSWNPQTSNYIRCGRLDCKYMEEYVMRTFFETSCARRAMILCKGKYKLRRASVVKSPGDLRCVLVRYWSYYIAYKLSNQAYIEPSIDRMLSRKGMR